MDSITPISRVRSCFFWVSALAIALISILLAIHTTATPNASSSIVFSIDNEIVTEVVEENYIEKLISLLKRIVRRATRHHHHPHHHPHSKKDDSGCDDNKWTSMIAQSYLRPSLVLTVDLMGCGNFTSVQKAVDAVPDNSPDRTFILFGAGVYRLWIHSFIESPWLDPCLFFSFFRNVCISDLFNCVLLTISFCFCFLNYLLVHVMSCQLDTWLECN